MVKCCVRLLPSWWHWCSPLLCLAAVFWLCLVAAAATPVNDWSCYICFLPEESPAWWAEPFLQLYLLLYLLFVLLLMDPDPFFLLLHCSETRSSPTSLPAAAVSHSFNSTVSHILFGAVQFHFEIARTQSSHPHTFELFPLLILLQLCSQCLPVALEAVQRKWDLIAQFCISVWNPVRAMGCQEGTWAAEWFLVAVACHCRNGKHQLINTISCVQKGQNVPGLIKGRQLHRLITEKHRDHKLSCFSVCGCWLSRYQEQAIRDLLWEVCCNRLRACPHASHGLSSGQNDPLFLIRLLLL